MTRRDVDIIVVLSQGATHFTMPFHMFPTGNAAPGRHATNLSANDVTGATPRGRDLFVCCAVRACALTTIVT